MGASRAEAPARWDAFTADGTTVSLLVLNLLDGLFTLLFLLLGLAEELNPVMRLAYERSPMAFMALKLGIVHFGVTVLCLYRELRLARLALAMGVALYSGIVAYHLAFLADLLLR
ncbi:MAG: DUF5658 family protein [Myxococcaceae bacterium]|nr:DUF5658 family protein [Myxococcaceae bacterium]MCI0671634.1 DUF5658 family protein [Myxococcaceae bacterium]